MKSLLLLIISFFVCLALGHCSFIDFKEPEIVAHYPPMNAQGIDNHAIVWVEFSEKMDLSKTEEVFSLSSDSEMVKGEFHWESNRLSLTPNKPMITGERYTLRVAKDAEDENGNNLSDDLEVSFTVNSDSIKPRLLSNTPTHGQEDVPANTKLIFIFSEAISASSLIEGINISPDIVGDFALNPTQDAITFTAHGDFVYGTVYTITLNENLKDIAGNTLFESHMFSFIIGSDFIKPSIASVISGPTTLQFFLNTTGISKNNSIVITFSELMDENETLDAVNISPTASFTKNFTTIGAVPNQQTVLTLNFSPSLEAETSYVLSITTVAVDIYGNVLDQIHNYPFFTDAMDSIRPQVIDVQQQLATSGVCTRNVLTACQFDSCPTALGNCQRMGFDLSSAGTRVLGQNDVINRDHHIDIAPAPANDDSGVGGGRDIRIVILVNFDRDMDFSTLLNTISIEPIIGGANTPTISRLELTGARRQLRIYINRYIDANTYYRLTIRGTGRDTEDNPLKCSNATFCEESNYIIFLFT